MKFQRAPGHRYRDLPNSDPTRRGIGYPRQVWRRCTVWDSGQPRYASVLTLDFPCACLPVQARGEPSASKTLPAQPPPKKPPPEPPLELWRQKATKGNLAKGPEELQAADPWASGQDPWSQSMELTKAIPLSGDKEAPLLWKSPPLVKQPPSEDRGTDPWSAAKPISSVPLMHPGLFSKHFCHVLGRVAIIRSQHFFLIMRDCGSL